MKINDFIFRYRTNSFVFAGGICRVRTFLNSQNDVFVLLTELDENPSASVTNAMELIVDQLHTQEKIPLQAKIIEHYPSGVFPETFDFVTFASDGSPIWTPTSHAAVFRILECTDKEFDDYKTDPRVQKEIQDALLGIPKIQQFDFIEAPEITERRLEIESGMHSLKDVKDFLNSFPSESEMSAFLKQDMSLLAEPYAFPNEDYICFAEFPVGDGRVDFALFTGCSRMVVYLIEIKGAESPLRKKNHYGDFRADVQQGRTQLIERKTWCERHYEEFRVFVHRVLQVVSAEGKRPYRAFPGPNHHLNVDPNKDIHLRYILIAGRTSDDLRDSQKRHQEDAAMGFSIQTETWDSWVNKLTRK